MTTNKTLPNLRNPLHPLNVLIQRIVYALNGRWYKLGMQIFMIVIVLHLSEHIIQCFQLWVLHWPRPQCLGLLGLWQPWLIKTEYLHYAHALFMLLGFAVFRPSMTGKARFWWDAAFIIQFWHHFEHALLLGQALIHQNLNGFAAPVSIAQLVAQHFSGLPFGGQPWLPRIELHMFYNLIVLIPMLIALYYHRVPPTQKVTR
jgi:hypothetical protein